MTANDNEIEYTDFSRQNDRGMSSGYNYGSAAYDYDYEEQINRHRVETERKEKNKKRERLQRKERHVNVFHAIQLVAATAVFFIGSVALITAVSSVAEMRYTINELKEDLNTIQNENIVLVSDISNTINLDYIKDRAINELGMAEPQSYQIKTISVPEQSCTVQYSDSDSKMPEVDMELLREFFFRNPENAD